MSFIKKTDVSEKDWLFAQRYSHWFIFALLSITLIVMTSMDMKNIVNIVIVFAIAQTLAVLSGAWLGLGTSKTRWVWCSLLSILLCVIQFQTYDYPDRWYILSMVAICVYTPIIIVFTFSRLFRMIFQIKLEQVDLSNLTEVSRVAQFNLLHLIVVMTIIGILFPLIQNNVEFLTGTPHGVMLSLNVLIAACSLLVIWASLGVTWRIRLAVSFLGLAIAIVGAFLVAPDSSVQLA